MKEINPRPGVCICVARWNGDIIYYNPGKYLQHIRGEMPSKKNKHKRPNQTERRPADGRNR